MLIRVENPFYRFILCSLTTTELYQLNIGDIYYLQIVIEIESSNIMQLYGLSQYFTIEALLEENIKWCNHFLYWYST